MFGRFFLKLPRPPSGKNVRLNMNCERSFHERSRHCGHGGFQVQNSCCVTPSHLMIITAPYMGNTAAHIKGFSSNVKSMVIELPKSTLCVALPRESDRKFHLSCKSLGTRSPKKQVMYCYFPGYIPRTTFQRAKFHRIL